MKRLSCKISCAWLLLLLLAYGGMAQEKTSCMVLMEAISGSYEGDCRNGLAHGKGTALGWDTYRGQFKKGLPHGTGTYIWENGAVYFEAPNHFMAYTKMCEVEFTINEPGRWIVEIYY